MPFTTNKPAVFVFSAAVKYLIFVDLYTKFQMAHKLK